MIGVVMLVILGGAPTRSTDVATDLGPAEAAYRAGRYTEALGLFEAALAAPGIAEGPALYNLGNCAFRLGRYPEAILHWRRARLRLPPDEELELNIRVAERRLGLAVGPRRSLGAALTTPLEALGPSGLLIAASILETVGLVGLVFTRRRAVRVALASLVLIAVAGAGQLLATRWLPTPVQGVVLASEIPVRAKPHPSLPVTERLRSGETVRVVEHSDRWARITHAGGDGWIERAHVGLVD